MRMHSSPGKEVDAPELEPDLKLISRPLAPHATRPDTEIYFMGGINLPLISVIIDGITRYTRKELHSLLYSSLWENFLIDRLVVVEISRILVTWQIFCPAPPAARTLKRSRERRYCRPVHLNHSFTKFVLVGHKIPP